MVALSSGFPGLALLLTWLHWSPLKHQFLITPITSAYKVIVVSLIVPASLSVIRSSLWSCTLPVYVSASLTRLSLFSETNHQTSRTKTRKPPAHSACLTSTGSFPGTPALPTLFGPRTQIKPPTHPLLQINNLHSFTLSPVCFWFLSLKPEIMFEFSGMRVRCVINVVIRISYKHNPVMFGGNGGETFREFC